MLVCRLTVLLFAVLFFSPCIALSAEASGDCLPGCVIIGTVNITGKSLQEDLRARRAIDKLIPELIAKGKDRVVRLEGHSNSRMGKAAYVRESLYLAKEVEKYLRLDHKVNLDLYLTALDDKITPRNGKFVRIVVFPQELREKPGVIETIEKEVK